MVKYVCISLCQSYILVSLYKYSVYNMTAELNIIIFKLIHTIYMCHL